MGATLPMTPDTTMLLLGVIASMVAMAAGALLSTIAYTQEDYEGEHRVPVRIGALIFILGFISVLTTGLTMVTL